MEGWMILVLILLIPVILIPVAFVWYLNFGGIYAVIKEAYARRVAQDKTTRTAVKAK